MEGYSCDFSVLSSVPTFLYSCFLAGAYNLNIVLSYNLEKFSYFRIKTECSIRINIMYQPIMLQWPRSKMSNDLSDVHVQILDLSDIGVWQHFVFWSSLRSFTAS